MSATAPLDFDGDMPSIPQVDANAADVAIIDLTGATDVLDLDTSGITIEQTEVEAAPIEISDPTDDPAMRFVYVGMLLFVVIVALAAILALA